jgi:hypothetical protein
MQIPTFAEQNPNKLPLFGLELGFGANGNFTSFLGSNLLPLRNELGLLLPRKKNYFLVALPKKSRLL